MSNRKLDRRKFFKFGITTGTLAVMSGTLPYPSLAVDKILSIRQREYFKSIYHYINSLPVFSDHEHHRPDDFFAEKMTLDRALENSYVAWTGYISDGTRISRQILLENVRYNSYFYWFEKGLQRIYGIEEPITLESWDFISQKLSKRYANDPNFHWKALKANGYEKLVLDTYWNPGDNNGHPGIFTAAFRIDKFMYGFHAESVAPNDFIPWERYGFKGGKLDDYVDLMLETIRAKHRAGEIVALKCAQAYERTIDFLPDDRVIANSIFGLHPSRPTQKQQLIFGNYIFNRCCELAVELDIPFQIHTGLARLQNSHPMKFLPIIKRHRKTRFILFHSGYPWTNDISGIIHNHYNALPSLTWTPIICTSEAIRVLHDYIDIARSINTITWGSDCWIPEESIGALLAWRFVVAKVLSERLTDGRLTVKNAELIARKLMYENGRKIYLKA